MAGISAHLRGRYREKQPKTIPVAGFFLKSAWFLPDALKEKSGATVIPLCFCLFQFTLRCLLGLFAELVQQNKSVILFYNKRSITQLCGLFLLSLS